MTINTNNFHPLLRLGVRLARKEELASTVVQSLRILLAIKPGSIFHVCKQVFFLSVFNICATLFQVAYGLHELLRNNAANIHSRSVVIGNLDTEI